MSRIGRLPIKINPGVSVAFADGIVTVTGPKGILTQAIECNKINIVQDNGELSVLRASETKEVKAKHGLYRALIYNMTVGVEKGFDKALVIAGVGYKAVEQQGKLVLSVGYSHTVDVVPPAGITLKLVSPTEILVQGIDKVKVGQFAADIKSIRKPEPYHGYGIRYKNETILRKAGKQAGKK
ncbi:MAG: 50S ribosomal protein L6 [Christensenellaceae bacterium]|jgi:large subunit ribosomal protein L6|nr:50S ribosomal protein L6 [Christensenellaceae bacterium]